MFGPIIDRMLHFNLGKVGRAIVTLIQENMLIFLVLFIAYASCMLYAKYVRTRLIPEKMKEFLISRKASGTLDELFNQWLAERQTWPKYLVVPTTNELWIKPASHMTGNEKMLFYTTDSQKMTENELFTILVKELR